MLEFIFILITHICAYVFGYFLCMWKSSKPMLDAKRRYDYAKDEIDKLQNKCEKQLKYCFEQQQLLAMAARKHQEAIEDLEAAKQYYYSFEN